MKEVIVNDLMQSNYKYFLTQPIGKNFDSEFIGKLNSIFEKNLIELNYK